MVQQDSASEVLFEEAQQFRQSWLWALLFIMFLVFTVTFAGAIFIDPQMAVITPGAVWIGMILFFLLRRRDSDTPTGGTRLSWETNVASATISRRRRCAAPWLWGSDACC